jgi:hypothetical protein
MLYLVMLFAQLSSRAVTGITARSGTAQGTLPTAAAAMELQDEGAVDMAQQFVPRCCTIQYRTSTRDHGAAVCAKVLHHTVSHIN